MILTSNALKGLVADVESDEGRDGGDSSRSGKRKREGGNAGGLSVESRMTPRSRRSCKKNGTKKNMVQSR